MSDKTCQLCGKPLGRRSDGEFCSSEHRNQFRLRRGMDRLEEANKVASLMRRRENPRPIPPEQLLVLGAAQPVAATAATRFPVRQLEPAFTPLKPALFQVRIAKRETRFSNPLSELARRSGLSENRCSTPAAVAFVCRRPAAELKGMMKPEAALLRAGVAAVRCEIPAPEQKARECGAALRVSRRASVPQRRVELMAAGTECLEKTRRPQTVRVVATAPESGAATVHGRREFQKRAPVLRVPERDSSSGCGLPGPQLRPGVRPAIQDMPPGSRACVIEPREGTVRFPRLAVSLSAAVGVAAPLSLLNTRAGEMLGGPGCSLPWQTASSVKAPEFRSAFRGGSFGTADPVAFFAFAEGTRQHRPAEVRFAPAESPFDHAPIALQGSFHPGEGDASRTSELIEEHFDSGLDQWTGDLVEWKLDAAGARPAGLALLRPTVALADYEFEFFTRIESRAVTFAFRAANVSNYFKITIAMVESGRYELRRCAVIGGIEEPGAAAPLPGVLRPGAAFTVKTRAWQNDFTIWLDGELAAKWTDGRLPSGGVGFMAPRDDRARVYWVRLSQLDGPNSQAASHRPVRSIQ